MGSLINGIKAIVKGALKGLSLFLPYEDEMRRCSI
jgi:hypothetical protein